MTLKLDWYIIKLLLIYNNIYNTYYKYINISNIKNNNKILYKVYLCISILKEKYPKEYHTVDDLKTVFVTQYPVLSKEESVQFQELCAELETLQVSDDDRLVLDYMEKYKERDLTEQIAITALDVSQGRKSKEQLHELHDELFSGDLIKQDRRVLEVDLDATVDHFQGTGIKWRLRTLNRILGSLRRGNFGFIFARPEIGKTTFLASEATFFAPQLDGPLLWCNNEESTQQITLRNYVAALGQKKEEVLRNIPASKARFLELTGGNIKIVDTEYCNKKDITAICKEIKPAFIIIDQLDKVKGFDSERYDLLQKSIYQWARELSKVYGPTIGVCQAGGSAEGKRYLDMNDIDSSMTAKQGEADWIIGIGGDRDNDLIRYLSVCKNKLPDADDTMRHAKVEVGMNPFIGRYEDRMF